MIRNKKKFALITLTSFCGIFGISLLLAAILSTSPEVFENDFDVDSYKENGEGRHVNGYVTNFSNKEAQTSVYAVKYDDAIEQINQEYVYLANQANRNYVEEAVLSSDSDQHLSLFVEDFLVDIAKKVDQFFEQIKTDRSNVQTSHFLRLETLKKAFNNDVEQIEKFIIECRYKIENLDSNAENYSSNKDEYERRIEIYEARIGELNEKYNYDVECENDSFYKDMEALNDAEKDLYSFKGNIASPTLEDIDVNVPINGDILEQAFEPEENNNQVFEKVEAEPVENDDVQIQKEIVNHDVEENDFEETKEVLSNQNKKVSNKSQVEEEQVKANENVSYDFEILKDAYISGEPKVRDED